MTLLLLLIILNKLYTQVQVLIMAFISIKWCVHYIYICLCVCISVSLITHLPLHIKYPIFYKNFKIISSDIQPNDRTMGSPTTQRETTATAIATLMLKDEQQTLTIKSNFVVNFHVKQYILRRKNKNKYKNKKKKHHQQQFKHPHLANLLLLFFFSISPSLALALCLCHFVCLRVIREIYIIIVIIIIFVVFVIVIITSVAIHI